MILEEGDPPFFANEKGCFEIGNGYQQFSPSKVSWRMEPPPFNSLAFFTMQFDYLQKLSILSLRNKNIVVISFNRVLFKKNNILTTKTTTTNKTEHKYNMMLVQIRYEVYY